MAHQLLVIVFSRSLYKSHINCVLLPALLECHISLQSVANAKDVTLLLSILGAVTSKCRWVGQGLVVADPCWGDSAPGCCLGACGGLVSLATGGGLWTCPLPIFWSQTCSLHSHR